MGNHGRLTRGDADRRRALILGEVRALGHVSVVALSEELDVTEMTIRRDLRQLESEGLVSVVHGGATLGGLVPVAFGTRAVEAALAKRRIGSWMAEHLPTRGVVGVDGGTTTLEVATQLPSRFEGTVVTNSVPVLAALIGRPKVHTICLGGHVNPGNQSMMSPQVAAALMGVHLDVAVLGATAFDSAGAYVHNLVEQEVKRGFVMAADRVAIVMDASKFDVKAPLRMASPDEIELLVTDAPPPAAVATAARMAGCTIQVV